MKHLCYNDICTIMCALSADARSRASLAEVITDEKTRGNILEDRDDLLRLHDYFREIADRLLDIDLGKAVHITAKFHK